MATTKRVSRSDRGHRTKTAPRVPRMLRSKSARRIVRWIGAGRRRPSKQGADTKSELAQTNVIRLSWADALGRPTRVDISWLGRPRTIDAQVLRFRHRTQIGDAPSVAHGAIDQPSRPILR